MELAEQTSRTPHANEPPLLFVISGPSGAGKRVALDAVRVRLGIEKVATYTTRPKRHNEEDGVDYHYITDSEFRTQARAGEFLEFTRTYGSHLYASPISVMSHDRDTRHAIFELSPDGFFYLKQNSTRRVCGIFVLPLSLEILRSRLLLRGDVPDLEDRMTTARRQIGLAWQYDFVIMNDDLNTFQSAVCGVVQARLDDNAARSKLAGELALDRLSDLTA